MTKTAENLQNLVQTLEKRNSLKTDYVVPTQKLIWTSDNEFIVNTDAEQQLFYKPTELFESQITYIGIIVAEELPSISRISVKHICPSRGCTIRSSVQVENHSEEVSIFY